jgi:3-oxoacyl-[acyl-carrier-protein] synthase I
MTAGQIIAVAARTPVGVTAETTAAAIRAGVSRVLGHPTMVDPEGEPLNSACDQTLPAAQLGVDRLIELARKTLLNLCEKLAPSGASIPHVHFFLALPELRPGLNVADTRRLLDALGAQTVPGVKKLSLQSEGEGHAGGLTGLRKAIHDIEQDKAEVCIVGGVDGYLHADTIEWLDRDRRLARAGVRGGFPPGEAAAMIALSSERMRRQLGLPALAQVAAVACAQEVRDENAPEGLLGEALTEAYSQVAQRLRRPEERFDDVYSDINDERPRTTDYGFALLRAGELFRDGTNYVTPVAQVGDVGAATAPLNIILAIRAWARGYATGPNALVSAASWNGLRCAALLQKPGG